MRYFIELGYNGSNYAGFQIQANANTIQAEVEKVLSVLFRKNIALTGSSRTDAGVHAFQNYFHFDVEESFKQEFIYNLNAILPRDIVVKSVFPVAEDAHCRFLALSREYTYFITAVKNPFAIDTAWYYPFAINLELLNEAARILFNHVDYTSFSKRNTQAITKDCTIMKSVWVQNDERLVFNIKANRFLRGMVRGLVGTMLLVGRKKISLSDFEQIILSKDCTKVNFATPAHGLFLVEVAYPDTMRL